MQFLNSFKLSRPGLISGIIVLVVVFVMDYYFVLVLKLDLLGEGLAFSIGVFLQFLYLTNFLFHNKEVRPTLFMIKFNR